jgi:predicted DNA-binding protein (MmcQ/YjbR family)
MSGDPLQQLRMICLEYPEAVETGGVGDPSFKVRDKIFAMRHQFDGRASIWCKAPPGAQEILVGSNPQRFFVPPYVGQHGWVGVWLEHDVDWSEIADLIDESYRMTAPKRLVRMLDSST